MRFILALLLIASTAIGQSVSYPSASSVASVVTNSGVVVTNNFSSDPTLSGWTFNDIQSNGQYSVTWDASQSNVFISHPGGSSAVRAAPASPTGTVYPSGVWTVSVTRAQDAWSFQMYALSGTAFVGRLSPQDYFYSSGNGGFTGTVSGVFTASWERIGIGFNGGGALTARVYSVAVSGPVLSTNVVAGVGGSLVSVPGKRQAVGVSR